jgi:hypothetical protein
LDFLTLRFQGHARQVCASIEVRTKDAPARSPDSFGSGLQGERGLQLNWPSGYFTVSVTGVVLETPPPLPFTVMVKVPVVAERLTEIFMVELPFPPEMEEGLKPMLVPLF